MEATITTKHYSGNWRVSRWHMLSHSSNRLHLLIPAPRHPSIGVMWAQQQSTLQSPSSLHTQSGNRVLFGTAEALCSAASQYYLWDRQIANPDRTLCDLKTRKVFLADEVRPTGDAMGYGLMATGMCKQMEDESKPQ